MYSNGNLNLNINDVVDNISNEKIEWAIIQVKNTLKKTTDKYNL